MAQPGANPAEGLTPREREVLELLRLGLTNGEIAARLDISADGAKYHVSAIIGKLGVRNRHEASVWPERPPWWMGATAPVGLLVREARASWLGTAAVFVAIAAGTAIGLLIWGIVRTDGESAVSVSACVPGEAANYFILVEGTSFTDAESANDGSFRGPASSTVNRPTGDIVTVVVDETTTWVGDEQSVRDLGIGMQVQAAGRWRDDCRLMGATIVSSNPAIVLGEGLPGGIDWSPDGRSVAFVQSAALHAASAPDFEPREVLPAGDWGLISEPRWSPDGSRIAFLGFHDIETESDEPLEVQTLWLVNADGSDVRDLLPENEARLSTGSAGKVMQDWLDNETIAFDQHCGTGCQQPYLLHLATSELDPVIPDDPNVGGAPGTVYHYAPDRRRLAIDSQGGPPTVGAFDRSAGDLTFLAPLPDRNGPFRWFEAWAPDSGRFLYSEGNDAFAPTEPLELYEYDVAAGQSRLVATGKDGVYSQDGTRIAYLTEETDELSCGEAADCIAVIDAATGTERYRVAGPGADALREPFAEFRLQILADGRLVYHDLDGRVWLADERGRTLLLETEGVFWLEAAPDGASAVVGEIGRVLLVSIPER